MVNLHVRILPTRQGSNPQPSDHQPDVHPTEPPRPADSVLLNMFMDNNETCNTAHASKLMVTEYSIFNQKLNGLNDPKGQDNNKNVK